MNLAEMRTRVRRDLKDEVATPQTPDQLDDCDDLWTGMPYVDVSLDQTEYKQGIGCMAAIFEPGFASGLAAYHNIAAVDLHTYQQIRLWFKCVVALYSGVLQIVLDNSQSCASPLKYLPIPQCQANTWHHFFIDLGDASDLTDIVSIGLYATTTPPLVSVRLDHIQVYKSEYKWSDDELDRHIAHALEDFSYYLPYEYSAELATVSGSRDINIATLSGLVRVFGVEYPVGKYPARYQRYSRWQDTITLLGDVVPDGSNCKIFYGKTHTLDSESSTIPAHLEDLVSLGAQGYALQAYAAYAADRLQPDYRYAQERASADARQLLGDFRRQLRKLGRHGRLRSGSLYVPATIPVSKTTDWEP